MTLNDIKTDSVQSQGLTEEENDLIYCFAKKASVKADEEKETNEDSNKLTEIRLTSQFYQWLSRIESSDIGAENVDTNDLQHFYDENQGSCTDLKNQLQHITSLLNQLRKKHHSVAENTYALYEACNELSHSHDEMIERTQMIEHHLNFFTCLDSLEARMQNKSWIITRERCASTLTEIDGVIQFMDQHTDYLEAKDYKKRAAALLGQFLDVITSDITKTLAKVFKEISDVSGTLTADNSFMMLYGRFRSQSVKVRPLVELLESRLGVSDIYQASLEKCKSFMISHRRELLLPVVSAGIADLVAKYPKDNCALLRSSGSFLMHVCEDEAKLYNQFFSMEHAALFDSFCGSLCSVVYDELLPLFLQVNHVEVLAELCDILRNELLVDPPIRKGVDYSTFNAYVAMLLADIRERLVFRADVFMRDQILNYRPGGGDLSYPEKLEMMRSIADKTAAASVISPDAVAPGPHMSLAPADLHGMWFPTVRRTLICLSKLNRCLDREVFRGLAQECVAMCAQSLVAAAKTISAQKSLWDGELFLIKHLLILREQINPFNIELSMKETNLDFSHMKNMAKELLTSRGSGLLAMNRNNTLLRLLIEAPMTVEVHVDGRQQLDGILKEACNKLIASSATVLLQEIPEFLGQVQKAKQQTPPVTGRLGEQPFALPEKVTELSSKAYQTLLLPAEPTASDGAVSDLTSLLHKLNLYLANADTVHIMMQQVEARVLNAWQLLHSFVNSEAYTDEERSKISLQPMGDIRQAFLF